MNYGGKVCTILNNVLQKVTILLLTMFTILPEPHQKSGRTLIIYCTFCKYVIVICRSYTSRPTCYYVLVFFILHHDVRMYDFYGPIVPEINYSILFYSTMPLTLLISNLFVASILHHCSLHRNAQYGIVPFRVLKMKIED